MMWALALLIFLCDQWSKLIVKSRFILGEELQVIPGIFNLTYVHNSGAVWGILQNSSEWLAFFSLIAIVMISVFSSKIVKKNLYQEIAVGLILGGVAGNFVDRVKFGAVIDFLDFYFNKIHWPAFNIADAAICSGVVLYVISAFLNEIKKRDNSSLFCAG